MKAFVTGADGFVGRYLCAHLRDEGDEAIACDRSGAEGVDIVDRDAIHAVLADIRPDVVFHLAAFTHVGQSWTTPQAVLRVNVEGTANVLDAAAAAGVGRVVVIGSAEEYGQVREADLPLGEDAPLRPSTPYGASKVAASFLALQAHLGGGLDTIRVRPFNHTGPGQMDTFLVPALARRVALAEAEGRDEIAVGSLDPVRDLSDVRDVVRAYRLLARHGAPGEVYNVCSGTGVSVGEIAERLLARSSRPIRAVVDPDLVRPVDVPRLVGDPTKLKATTGWEPRHSLDDTLASVLTAARANPTIT